MSLSVTVSQFAGGVNGYNNESARGVANYLYWICGKFSLEAQYKLGNGTGATVLPIYTKPIPSPIDFTVAEAGSYMIAGQSTITIPSYKNYNIIFVRGGIAQPSIDLGSSYYNWDRGTAKFTCYPAASDGEIFQLTPTI